MNDKIIEKCPFCGFQKCEIFRDDTIFYVKCPNCHSHGPNEYRKEVAIFRWNNLSHAIFAHDSYNVFNDILNKTKCPFCRRKGVLGMRVFGEYGGRLVRVECECGMAGKGFELNADGISNAYRYWNIICETSKDIARMTDL